VASMPLLFLTSRVVLTTPWCSALAGLRPLWLLVETRRGKRPPSSQSVAVAPTQARAGLAALAEREPRSTMAGRVERVTAAMLVVAVAVAELV
jgi:hypothetical protein